MQEGNNRDTGGNNQAGKEGNNSDNRGKRSKHASQENRRGAAGKQNLYAGKGTWP